MKKFLALMLILVLCVSVLISCGCSCNEEPEDTNDTSSGTESTQDKPIDTAPAIDLPDDNNEDVSYDNVLD